MGRISDRHRVLTNGAGLCSVPMWQLGVPAGFCDAPAYGKPTDTGRLRYPGYVPALACYGHGGPKSPPPICILFDGPPGPEAGRFVEVEQGGQSINYGQWRERKDGFWELVLPR